MTHIAAQMMATGSPFIMEANFRAPNNVSSPNNADTHPKDDECAVLRALTERYAYNSLTFLFTGDLQVLHKRFLERETRPERGRIHRVDGALDDFTAFKEADQLMDGFNVNGMLVRVDTTDFEQVDFDTYIQQARTFMTGS